MSGIVENLLKRENDRQQEIIRKKTEQKLSEAKNEKTDYIETIVNQKITEISKMIDDTQNISKEKLPSHFDSTFHELNLLKKFISDSVIFLRNYDIRIFNTKLQDLESRIKKSEETLLPKKKFGFKNKPKAIIVDEVDSKTTANGKTQNGDSVITVKDYPTPHLNHFDEEFFGFRDISKQILTFEHDELVNKDVSLHNLENCIIKLHGNPNTLHISSLKHCTIMSGPVKTSIFAENCHNCHFNVSCQQLRFHKSNNCYLYLHVTSKAIIEDCNKIFTAPYNYFYDNLITDLKHANFDLKINNWDKIDDFNWLAFDKQSPNWSILEEDKRINDWNEFFKTNYEM